MKKLTLFLMALLFAITSKAESSITASWNIAEGTVLSSFKEVSITFAGTDSVGRKLVGTTAGTNEVKQIVLQNGTSQAIFFSVDSTGATTPVKATTSGVMTASRNGLVCTFSISRI